MARKTTSKTARAAITTQRTWGALLSRARTIYRREVERLATELRPRIRAGDFSGSEDGGRGGPMFCHLEWELQSTHRWCADAVDSDSDGPMGLLILACSTWPRRVDQMAEAERVNTHPVVASECIAHDVLAVAAKRRWIAPMRRLNEAHPYRLSRP